MARSVEINPSQEQSKNGHRSVRVFAVAPIHTDALAGQLAAGVLPDEISYVEVVLAQKADTHLVAAIGGELKPGEDLLHASMRNVFEKTLLTRESLSFLKETVGHGAPIPYSLVGQQCSREAFLVVMPVRGSTVSRYEPRENVGGDSVYKIKNLVGVTPDELGKLFSRGTVETGRGEILHICGHLTEAYSDDTSVSTEGRAIQHKEFNRVLDEVSSYEDTLKNAMKAHINRVRRWHKTPRIQSFGECSNEEIKEAFLAAQMNMGLADEKKRDMRGSKTPARPADLLNATVYLSEFEPDARINTLVSVPTQEIRRVRNILKYALRETVIELYRRMGADIKSGPQYVDTVRALKALWPEVISLPLTDRTQLVKVLNDTFVAQLARRLGSSEEVLHRAFTMPGAIARHIAEELPGVQFQQYHPINEVANAKPFTLLLFILGLHPNRNELPVRDIARDSLIAWSHIMTSIPVVERHMRADNGALEGALDTFLDAPRPEEIFLGGTNVPHKIYHRSTKREIGDKKLHLIIDERRMKTDERTTEKTYQSSNTYDDFSINFVIAGDNFPKDQQNDISIRLKKVNEIRDAFFTHFKNELQLSGWDAGIVDGTHKTDVLSALETYSHLRTEEEKKLFIEKRRNGSRAGSVGNLILREKFVVWYTQPDGRHVCEICIYPFEGLEDTPLARSGWIAFNKKLADNKSGRYAKDRLIQTNAEDPTGPALIELLEPPLWSAAARFAPIRKRQHTPKKTDDDA